MSPKAAVAQTNRLPPPDVVAAACQLVAGPRRHRGLAGHEALKTAVHRLSVDLVGGSESVVVKRLRPDRARVNELVAGSWLRAVGLESACPRLHGVVPERCRSAVWHVYEDVAGRGLDEGGFDRERVAPVVDLVAELHTRFADHALLAQCRDRSVDGDLGIGFFTDQVAQAIAALRAIGSVRRERAELRDRLLERLERLDRERAERAQLMRESQLPVTLLHGDLWTSNTLVLDGGSRPRAKLIDWDHVGVGPVTYDLSTFLYRFSAEHRPWIVGRYREALGRGERRLPGDATLNRLFETAECARYACCVVAPALAAARAEPWGFAQLAEVDTWFAGLEPVL